jgi:hypothetical protein
MHSEFHFKDHCNYITHKVFFTSRCLVATFNIRYSPSYDILIELHTSKITVTEADIKSTILY